jgi:hypothetical protein
MHYWSGRRLAVAVVFVGTLAAVPLLGRRADSSTHVGPDAAGFRLESVAQDIGVVFTHRAPVVDPMLDNVAPHVTALGASVTVTDVNDDGWSDLYFTSSRFAHDNALYVNRGDGTFHDLARAAGVADLNREGEGVSMGAVWGDYDNDGLEDLLVYKYGYLQLLRNTGALSFEDVTEAAGLRRWMNANGAVWFDYDRDGLLDLYVAGYFRAEIDLWHLQTTRIMQNSFEFASNGGANVLFRNLGDGRFADVTDSLGVGSTRWTMAVAAADFNDDGWPDLYLANDYGPEELYENQEGRRFTLSFAGVDTDSKSGMSVSLGDVLNRGRHDVFVTNISERGYLFQGNNLRLNYLEETHRFREVARGVVADAGWAWGAQFGDLNNDGWMDLFVANGFISADPDRDYWYGMSKVAGATGAVFEDAASWPPIGTASLSGYEQSRVLLNREGRLTDVAEAVGVTDRYDGRAVAFVDLFNRGVLDVVVANQGAPALVYRNTVPPGNHWIAFELVGTRSNRSAIGAEVVAAFGGRRQRRVVAGAGEVQRLKAPAVDRLHVVTEPVRPLP